MTTLVNTYRLKEGDENLDLHELVVRFIAWSEFKNNRERALVSVCNKDKHDLWVQGECCDEHRAMRTERRVFQQGFKALWPEGFIGNPDAYLSQYFFKQLILAKRLLINPGEIGKIWSERDPVGFWNAVNPNKFNPLP